MRDNSEKNVIVSSINYDISNVNSLSKDPPLKMLHTK